MISCEEYRKECLRGISQCNDELREAEEAVKQLYREMSNIILWETSPLYEEKQITLKNIKTVASHLQTRKLCLIDVVNLAPKELCKEVCGDLCEDRSDLHKWLTV